VYNSFDSISSKIVLMKNEVKWLYFLYWG
jgi:hypothetical protein